MSDTLLAHEPLIRGGVFALVLLAMVLREIVASRRPQMIHRRQRWPSNLAIGTEAFREAHDLRLDRMLLQPFVNPVRDVK
ncbi:MAG: hypothetical protein LC652_13710 [Halomonas sp.]|nr:hypothetical protein [Halomonas sp.]